MKYGKPITLILLGLVVLKYLAGYDYIQLGSIPALLLLQFELILFIKIALDLRNIRREFKNSDDTLFIDQWKTTLKNALGDNMFVKFFSSETLIMMSALFGWFKKYELKPNQFSYHKKGKIKYIVIILFFVSLIELPVVHILLDQINTTFAWVVTLLSIYSLFWILGDYKLHKFTPIHLTKDKIMMRIGVRWKVDIDYSLINKIEQTKKAKKDERIILTPDSDFNILLHLKEEVEIEGLFGKKSRSDCIALRIDEVDKFEYRLETLLRDWKKAKQQKEQIDQEEAVANQEDIDDKEVIVTH